MGSYQLSIAFTRDGIDLLKEVGQSVGLIEGTPGGGGLLVAGAVFAPNESNALSWDDDIDVYAALGGVLPLSVLSVNARCPAGLGNCYSFEDGTISGAGPGSPDVVQLRNHSDSVVGAGLARPITINGTKPDEAGPTTVVGILDGGLGTFPVGRLFLLIPINAPAGTIIPSSWLGEVRPAISSTSGFSAGPGLTLDFAASTSYTVSFDAASGRFQIDR